MDAPTASILDGYVKESVFAVSNNISKATSARYRHAGLPYLVWGGEIYISVAGARDWLAGRSRKRNTRIPAMA